MTDRGIAATWIGPCFVSDPAVLAPLTQVYCNSAACQVCSEVECLEGLLNLQIGSATAAQRKARTGERITAH